MAYDKWILIKWFFFYKSIILVIKKIGKGYFKKWIN